MKERALSRLLIFIALPSMRNRYLTRPLLPRTIPDRRTSGSAPCSCGAEKWIKRAVEERKDDDDELVDARHANADDQRRNSPDSAAVLPLVEATSELLAVAARGERQVLSEQEAIQQCLSSAEEEARARRLIFFRSL